MRWKRLVHKLDVPLHVGSQLKLVGFPYFAVMTNVW